MRSLCFLVAIPSMMAQSIDIMVWVILLIIVCPSSVQERRDVIKDLSLLAKEDRTHRRKALTNMPVCLLMRYIVSWVNLSHSSSSLLAQDNLFQPVAQQVRQKEEKQRHLEHIFEKMYIKSQGMI